MSPSSQALRRPRAVRMSAPDRIAQIFRESTLLIAERGYWGLTLRDVAYACGLTEAGLLHHVHSKDELLIALLQHRDDADNAVFTAGLGITVAEMRSLDPLPIGLARFTTAIAEHNASQPEIVQLYSVLVAEAVDAGHPAHDFFIARQARVLSVFARAARDQPDSERVARHALAAMDGLQILWLRNYPKLDLVDEWRAIIAALLRPGRCGL